MGNCFMYWFWKWYMRCTLDFPVNTTYATFDQYKEHLNAAGFSEVRVLDITNIAIRPFYNNMTKIIHIPTNFRSLIIRVCWQINKTQWSFGEQRPYSFPHQVLPGRV